jgi:cobalt transporter subunit CbtA
VIRRFLASALLAGLIAGLGVTVLQSFTTTPLIALAETYEQAAPAAAHAHDHMHDGTPGPEDGWAPADGLERLFFTTLANVVAGVGFAFVLVACLALWSGKASGKAGVVWGLAGFAVFTLAPSLGLSPELPAMNASGLVARQLWWIFAAAATAGGLWLMVFCENPLAIAAGMVALALPHIVGAPHPHDLSAQIPPELAARFAAASIATSAVFWAGVGWLAGTIYGRAPDGEAAR